MFCLPQVSLGRFQVSTCRSRDGLQALLKPGWRSRLQAGGAQPSQCKGTGDEILKPVVSGEPQAIPSVTWLVPDVVGKWEIKWPHTHKMPCSSPLFLHQGCSLPASCLCPGDTCCRELRTHPCCSYHLVSMRPPLCEHPHTRNKGLERSSDL